MTFNFLLLYYSSFCIILTLVLFLHVIFVNRRYVNNVNVDIFVSNKTASWKSVMNTAEGYRFQKNLNNNWSIQCFQMQCYLLCTE